MNKSFNKKPENKVGKSNKSREKFIKKELLLNSALFDFICIVCFIFFLKVNIKQINKKATEKIFICEKRRKKKNDFKKKFKLPLKKRTEIILPKNFFNFLKLKLKKLKKENVLKKKKVKKLK